MNKLAPVLLGLGVLIPSLADAASPRPIYQKLKACKIEGFKEDGLCGTLAVWENRATKQGRRIDLNVVVVPASDADPAPDPVFYINGGPGYGSTGAAGLANFLADVHRRHDFVFVDQRGTGKSHPLHCVLPGGPDDLQGYVRTLFPLPVLE